MFADEYLASQMIWAAAIVAILAIGRLAGVL